MKTQTVGEGPGALVVETWSDVWGRKIDIRDGSDGPILVRMNRRQLDETDELAMDYGVSVAEAWIAWRDRTRPEDPARAALARLVAVNRKMFAPVFPSGETLTALHAEHDAAIAEAERALEEPERDWKAEARDDWSKRALEDAK